MQLSEESPGIVIVRYETADDLHADPHPIISRLEARSGPVVVVFDFGDQVRSVPIHVPTFWLGATAQRDLNIAGVAIITRALAVKVAAKGFALANLARRLAMQVSVHASRDEGLAWAKSELNKPAQAT